MAKQYIWATGPLKLLPTPSYKSKTGKEDPFTDTASQMAMVHNCFIRAFNAIYHLAPVVPKGDLKNFVAYSLEVCRTLEHHHQEEEAYIFPEIEKQTGQTGIMSQNIEQHAAFHDHLEGFSKYLSDLITSDPTRFDPTKFRSLFDAFAIPLQAHLETEIDTLLDTRKYANPDFNLSKLAEDAAQKAVANYTFTGTLPVLMLNHDRSYEDSYIDSNWPEVPWPVSFVIRRVATYWNLGWWKFATCDAGQWPKDLPYLDE